MPSDPLANIIDRLRGRGYQPRKVGQDTWESRCPGHGGTEHALATARSADGKLVVTCRSTEKCSLSRIAKRLDMKIERLYSATNPTLSRKLQRLEIVPSIFSQPGPVVTAIDQFNRSKPESEPVGAVALTPDLLSEFAELENGEKSADPRPRATHDDNHPAVATVDDSDEVPLSIDSPLHDVTTASDVDMGRRTCRACRPRDATNHALSSRRGVQSLRRKLS